MRKSLCPLTAIVFLLILMASLDYWYNKGAEKKKEGGCDYCERGLHR